MEFVRIVNRCWRKEEGIGFRQEYRLGGQDSVPILLREDAHESTRTRVSLDQGSGTGEARRCACPRRQHDLLRATASKTTLTTCSSPTNRISPSRRFTKSGAQCKYRVAMRRNCTLWARSQYPCVAEAEGLPIACCSRYSTPEDGLRSEACFP